MKEGLGSFQKLSHFPWLLVLMLILNSQAVSTWCRQEQQTLGRGLDVHLETREGEVGFWGLFLADI